MALSTSKKQKRGNLKMKINLTAMNCSRPMSDDKPGSTKQSIVDWHPVQKNYSVTKMMRCHRCCLEYQNQDIFYQHLMTHAHLDSVKVVVKRLSKKDIKSRIGKRRKSRTKEESRKKMSKIYRLGQAKVENNIVLQRVQYVSEEIPNEDLVVEKDTQELNQDHTTPNGCNSCSILADDRLTVDELSRDYNEDTLNEDSFQEDPKENTSASEKSLNLELSPESMNSDETTCCVDDDAGVVSENVMNNSVGTDCTQLKNSNESSEENLDATSQNDSVWPAICSIDQLNTAVTLASKTSLGTDEKDTASTDEVPIVQTPQRYCDELVNAFYPEEKDNDRAVSGENESKELEKTPSSSLPLTQIVEKIATSENNTSSSNTLVPDAENTSLLPPSVVVKSVTVPSIHLPMNNTSIPVLNNLDVLKKMLESTSVLPPLPMPTSTASISVGNIASTSVSVSVTAPIVVSTVSVTNITSSSTASHANCVSVATANSTSVLSNETDRTANSTFSRSEILSQNVHPPRTQIINLTTDISRPTPNNVAVTLSKDGSSAIQPLENNASCSASVTPATQVKNFNGPVSSKSQVITTTNVSDTVAGHSSTSLAPAIIGCVNLPTVTYNNPGGLQTNISSTTITPIAPTAYNRPTTSANVSVIPGYGSAAISDSNSLMKSLATRLSSQQMIQLPTNQPLPTRPYNFNNPHINQTATTATVPTLLNRSIPTSRAAPVLASGYRCPQCGKLFPTSIELVVHVKNHSGITCPICQMVLNNQSVYKQHLASHNPASNHYQQNTASNLHRQSIASAHQQQQIQHYQQRLSHPQQQQYQQIYHQQGGSSSHPQSQIAFQNKQQWQQQQNVLLQQQQHSAQQQQRLQQHHHYQQKLQEHLRYQQQQQRLQQEQQKFQQQQQQQKLQQSKSLQKEIVEIGDDDVQIIPTTSPTTRGLVIQNVYSAGLTSTSQQNIQPQKATVSENQKNSITSQFFNNKNITVTPVNSGIPKAVSQPVITTVSRPSAVPTPLLRNKELTITAIQQPQSSNNASAAESSRIPLKETQPAVSIVPVQRNNSAPNSASNTGLASTPPQISNRIGPPVVNQNINNYAAVPPLIPISTAAGPINTANRPTLIPPPPPPPPAYPARSSAQVQNYGQSIHNQQRYARPFTQNSAQNYVRPSYPGSSPMANVANRHPNTVTSGSYPAYPPPNLNRNNYLNSVQQNTSNQSSSRCLPCLTPVRPMQNTASTISIPNPRLSNNLQYRPNSAEMLKYQQSAQMPPRWKIQSPYQNQMQQQNVRRDYTRNPRNIHESQPPIPRQQPLSHLPMRNPSDLTEITSVTMTTVKTVKTVDNLNSSGIPNSSLPVNDERYWSKTNNIHNSGVKNNTPATTSTESSPSCRKMPSLDMESYTCGICSNDFTNETDLSSHLLVHTREHTQSPDIIFCSTIAFSPAPEIKQEKEETACVFEKKTTESPMEISITSIDDDTENNAESEENSANITNKDHDFGFVISSVVSISDTQKKDEISNEDVAQDVAECSSSEESNTEDVSIVVQEIIDKAVDINFETDVKEKLESSPMSVATEAYISEDDVNDTENEIKVEEQREECCDSSERNSSDLESSPKIYESLTDQKIEIIPTENGELVIEVDSAVSVTDDDQNTDSVTEESLPTSNNSTPQAVENSFPCVICDQIFHRHVLLQKHMKSHALAEKEFEDTRVAKSKKSLKRKLIKTTDFSSTKNKKRRQMNNHLQYFRSKYSIAFDRRVACGICKKVFGDYKVFRGHKRYCCRPEMKLIYINKETCSLPPTTPTVDETSNPPESSSLAIPVVDLQAVTSRLELLSSCGVTAFIPLSYNQETGQSFTGLGIPLINGEIMQASHLRELGVVKTISLDDKPQKA